MTEPAARPPVPTAERILSVAGGLGGELFFYGLFWGGIVLGLFVLSTVLTGTLGTVESSIWADVSGFTRYLFDVAGVAAVVVCLPMYVGYGVTRREFVAGAIPAGLAVALIAALAAALVFALEAAVYGLADWPHVLDGDDTQHLFDRPDQYGTIVLEGFAVYGSHLFSGLVVGASFLRLGAVGGALLLPLTALPSVGTEMALGAGGAGGALDEALDLTLPPLAVGLLIAVALAAAAAFGARVLTRNIPLDSHRVMWWR